MQRFALSLSLVLACSPAPSPHAGIAASATPESTASAEASPKPHANQPKDLVERAGAPVALAASRASACKVETIAKDLSEARWLLPTKDGRVLAVESVDESPTSGKVRHTRVLDVTGPKASLLADVPGSPDAAVLVGERVMVSQGSSAELVGISLAKGAGFGERRAAGPIPFASIARENGCCSQTFLPTT